MGVARDVHGRDGLAGCETHARQLGRRALLFYDGDADSAQAAIAAAKRHEDRGHGTRQILRATILFLSIAIPIGFVGYAGHVRHSTGINWLGALGALVAVSLVLAAYTSPTGDGPTTDRRRIER